MNERAGGLWWSAFLLFGVTQGALQWWITGSAVVGLVLGVLAGALFVLVLRIFIVAVQRFRVFGLKEVDGWADGETIVRAGGANFMRPGLAEGGRLFLTDRRLRFVPHRFNVEVGDHSFPIDGVRSAEPSRTLGLVPNGLTVHLQDGRTLRFVVFDRMAWVAAIVRQAGLQPPLPVPADESGHVPAPSA